MANGRPVLSVAQQNQDQDNEELQSAVARLGIRSTAPPLKVFRTGQHLTNPAKGVGWFAKVDIQHGTPLIAEKALFEVVGDYDDVVITAKRDWLSQSNQEAFGKLAGPSATSTPRQILDRNAFEMHTTQQRKKKMGIFLETSRLNHSCKPNAHWTWNRLLSRLTVHAMANISMGDEITISYCPASEYRKMIQRNTDISQRYGFQCDCELCQHQLPFGAGSEARRRKMRDLKKKIDADTYPPNDKIQRLQDIGKLEDLIRQEDLIYPMLADICGLVAKWYQSTLLGDGSRAVSYENGNRLTALEFARKGLDLDVACTGHKSPEVTKTLGFIRRLKG